ncbi:MAG TPA: hypothetical protein VK205_07750 [Prolixibacteraceae bacterium]|nr:hypothetical protein [Lentimicrobium sp.]HLN73175.1 hypothetical protein [Prolixibacteraceae bacterium]
MFSNNTHRFLVLLFLILQPFFTWAQGKKPVRIEVPVKDDTEIYKVVPLNNNGCAVLFLSSENGKNGQMNWVTAFYDNKLKQTAAYNFEMPRGFLLEEALYKDDHLVAFFYTKRTSADTNFYLVDFNIPDSSITTLNYPVPERAGISHFDLNNEFAIAGINTRNERSMILKYNLNDQSISLLSPGLSEKTVVESASVNNITGGFSVILRTNQSLKKRNYFLVKFNRTGEAYFTHMFTKFPESLINTAYIHEIDNRSDIIIGSYGVSSRIRTIEGIEMSGVASTGFFSITIHESGEETINTYDFTEFDRFYRYLRRPADITPRRTILRRERPVSDLSTDHNLLTHRLFKQNGEFVFIAEAYYPEYRTVTTMVYDYYGRPYPSTYAVFEGYRYLTTFVAGFDENGQLKWNNDLELSDALTNTLNEKVTPYTSDSTNLMLCYVDNDRIAYKIINKGQNLTNLTFAKIEPLQQHDKVQKESNSFILPWYKDYFLVHGYQTLRNSYTSEKAKNVFYMSKMAFRL